jgi:hypothetical protein
MQVSPGKQLSIVRVVRLPLHEERGFGDRVVAIENMPPDKFGFSYILLKECKDHICALVNVVMNFLLSLKDGYCFSFTT